MCISSPPKAIHVLSSLIFSCIFSDFSTQYFQCFVMWKVIFHAAEKRLQILWGFFFEKTSINCRSVDVFIGSILLIIPRLPQMVDRLVVQLQDLVSALRSSQEPNVKNEINTAKNYIQDADKLKQVCSMSDFSWCNCVNGKVTIFLAWHGR